MENWNDIMLNQTLKYISKVPVRKIVIFIIIFAVVFFLLFALEIINPLGSNIETSKKR